MKPYSAIRSLLFQLNPETAHDLTLKMMGLGLRGPVALAMRAMTSDQPCKVMGLRFPNRIGLAAGMDKNADHVEALGALGFGHIEVGTLTPLAQEGNPKPRLYRLPEHEAVINRMGFNNKGIDYAIKQLKHRRFRGIVGINIGKNKITANADAASDYLTCLRKAYAYADYITVNISSPNTPNLRELQTTGELERLLEILQNEKINLATQHQREVPLALKIAPDINEPEMDNIARCALQYQLDGLIIGNTTISRPGIADRSLAAETGGLSGKPLMELSTKVLHKMKNRLGDSIDLIGCGGILSAADAQEKLQAGASLVQIYTGLIYKGPGLVREIIKSTNRFGP